MICFTLLGGCARDLVTAPHQDWSVPLVVYGRMLEKDALAQMPDYERNQEVCKRTDAAFRRVDYLNDLSDRITASGNEQSGCRRMPIPASESGWLTALLAIRIG